MNITALLKAGQRHGKPFLCASSFLTRLIRRRMRNGVMAVELRRGMPLRTLTNKETP